MVLILVVRKKLEGKAALVHHTEAREAEQEYQAKSFDHEYPAVLSMYG